MSVLPTVHTSFLIPSEDLTLHDMYACSEHQRAPLVATLIQYHSPFKVSDKDITDTDVPVSLLA